MGCGQGQFDFFVGGGGERDFKTNLNEKVGGRGQDKLIFLSINFVRNTFFLEWEGKAERGVIAFTAEA